MKAALQRVSVEANLRLAGSDQLKYLLKWPNDVLVRGQKLCGLLVEAEAMTDGGLAVVAGIGTNIIAAPEGTPTPATSLAALGVHIGAEELFAAQSDAWVEFRGIWDNGRGFGDIRQAVAGARLRRRRAGRDPDRNRNGRRHVRYDR